MGQHPGWRSFDLAQITIIRGRAAVSHAPQCFLYYRAYVSENDDDDDMDATRRWHESREGKSCD